MKDALYFAIILTSYGAGLLVFVSSFDMVSITTALNYNLIGGVIVFLFLSLVNFVRKR